MKKLLLLTIICISFVTFDANATKPTPAPPFKEINAEQLQQMQNDNADLIVIDSRGGKWFDGIMIKGAVNLSVKDTDLESLSKITANKDEIIVFYCTNIDCPASSLAAYKAKTAGYNNIYLYEAGIEDWVKKSLPTNK